MKDQDVKHAIADIVYLPRRQVVLLQEPYVQLLLSPEAAQALADVCAKIGGNPDKTRRRFFSDSGDSIAGQLAKVGYRFSDETLEDVSPNGVYFMSKEEVERERIRKARYGR